MTLVLLVLLMRFLFGGAIKTGTTHGSYIIIKNTAHSWKHSP